MIKGNSLARGSYQEETKRTAEILANANSHADLQRLRELERENEADSGSEGVKVPFEFPPYSIAAAILHLR
jgi:predicted nucleic acid-binding Zn ribbon protein